MRLWRSEEKEVRGEVVILRLKMCLFRVLVIYCGIIEPLWRLLDPLIR